MSRSFTKKAVVQLADVYNALDIPFATLVWQLKNTPQSKKQ